MRAEVFRQTGAEVIAIHAEPDGLNINDACGSTHLGSLKAAVLEHEAARDQLRRVMHRALAVAVVADRAVELVVAQNPVERLRASSMSGRCRRGGLHVFLDGCRTGANEFAIDLHDAGVASLNRSQLGGDSRPATICGRTG